MAPRQRQRRIVLTTQQPFSSDNEDLSPSPSETSSDCATSEQEYSSNGNSMDNCVRTKGDMAKEDHDIFNLFALVRFVFVRGPNKSNAKQENRQISHTNTLLSSLSFE
jgi:hypothetical protein